MNQIFLIIAAVCFAIGAVPESSSRANWTNAGLCFVTISLIAG